MTSQGFVERYAVRMPDGTLAKMGCHEFAFSDRAMAEQALVNMKLAAAQIGIHDWSGEIVRQLCTPWIGDRDNAEHLVADLQRWLETQTGGAA